MQILHLFSFFFVFFFSYHHYTLSVDNVKLPLPYLLEDNAINCSCLSNSTALLDGRRFVGETPLLFYKGKSNASASPHKLLTGSADPTPFFTPSITYTHFSYIFQVNSGQIFNPRHFFRDPYYSFKNSQCLFNRCKIHAFVNGMEIIYKPTCRYNAPNDNMGVQVIGQSNCFYKVDNSTAFELIHRSNVSDGSISSTGMFRRWSEDADYLLEYGFQQVDNLVPLTESMNNSVTLTEPIETPLDSGFGYLLRLNLCDLGVGSLEGARDEFIQHIVADVIVCRLRSGGYGIPVYRNSVCLVFKEDERVSSLTFGSIHGFMAAFTILMALVNTAVYMLRQHLAGESWHSKAEQSALTESSCRCFALAEILLATQNFSDAFVIGKGGFGHVYKGFIYGCPEVLAIKRSKPGSKQGAHEFWREIETLSKLRHIHLVSLIGYCNESNEMILVYEYMPRGTLADNLYKANKKGNVGIPLTWEQRLRICIGAARGLDYLHTGTKHGVIHRDVKNTNILLDENFIAKISDFGMAELGRMDGTLSKLSKRVRGTEGYLDPDYLRTRNLSIKTDVYAFGIVMLVVLSGKPALERKLFVKTWSLLSCYRDCIRKGDINKIIDSCLQGEFSMESLIIFMEAVKNCLHKQPRKRPTMSQLTFHLEQALEKQQGLLHSISVDETVMVQAGPSQPFEFYELKVIGSKASSSGANTTTFGQVSSPSQNIREKKLSTCITFIKKKFIRIVNRL